MTEITFDATQTLFVATLLALLGNWIIGKVDILRKYCLPGAVVGGLLFALLALALRQTGIVKFVYNTSLQEFFMNLFFAASGFGASLAVLKKGGKIVLILLVLASVCAFLQNALAVSLGMALGVEPMMALMTGSIALTGGHGYAASFAPLAVNAGYAGAMSVAMAAATFGLVSGAVIGGPLANRLVLKKNLFRPGERDLGEEADFPADHGSAKTEIQTIIRALFLIFVGLGIGAVLMVIFETLFPAVTWSIHVMAMVGGAMMRVTMDQRHIPVPEAEIEAIGDFFLTIFVSMAVFTMRLWELAELAVPIIVLLMAQAVLMIAFARYLTFTLTGGNYDAAAISAGHVGFGLGAVPVAMANMNALATKFRYSRLAFLVVPVVGGLFGNFTNAANIMLWINWCK